MHVMYSFYFDRELQTSSNKRGETKNQIKVHLGIGCKLHVKEKIAKHHHILLQILRKYIPVHMSTEYSFSSI